MGNRLCKAFYSRVRRAQTAMSLGEVRGPFDGLLIVTGRFVHLPLTKQAVALRDSFLRGLCPVLRVPVRAAQAEGNRQRGYSYVEELFLRVIRELRLLAGEISVHGIGRAKRV